MKRTFYDNKSRPYAKNSEEVKYDEIGPVVSYEFSSLLEFLYFIENKRKITSSHYSDIENVDGKNWHGTSSLDEAKELCRNGYFDKEVMSFQTKFLRMSKEINNAINCTQVKKDFVGFAPNVPLYLAGHPQNMINVSPSSHPKTPRPVNILFNVAIPWKESTSTIKKRGLCFLCLYQLLDKLNCNVNLQLCMFTRKINFFCLFLSIQLLKKGDTINISKLYFPMVHPAFERRLCLAFDERCPDLENRQKWFDNYGSVEHPSLFYKLTGKNIENDNDVNIFSDDYDLSSSNIKDTFKKIILDLKEKGCINMSGEEIDALFNDFDFSMLDSISSDNDCENER